MSKHRNKHSEPQEPAKRKCAGYFITGTGTDVGKTFVGSLLAKSMVADGLDVGVYKPVASGCELVDGQLVARDAEQLWFGAQRPKTLDLVTPQRFAAPLAPNVAARKEGRCVDANLLRTGLSVWMDSQCILVEGVGGLMSPISDNDLVVDLAAEFEFPLIVVVANQLGCINDALLTLRVANNYGLSTAGVFLNDVSQKDDESMSSNLDEIRRLSDVPFVERIEFEANSISQDIIRRLIP